MTRPPSKRTIRNKELLVQICRVQAKNFGVYGAKKLHAQLRREGVMVARCTGQRLMPAEGLRGITREKGPRITLAGDGPDTRLDLVERDFTATAPNQLPVADITCWRTFAGWVYAAFVIDVFSRRVLGWQLSKSLPGRPRPGRASTSSRSRPLSTSTGSTIAGSTARSA